MKFLKYLALVLIVLSYNLTAGNKTQEVIKKAMKDEMDRNIGKLLLDKLKKPFFISYTIVDGKNLSIKSSLGSIVDSDENPFRKQSAKVLVGDYNLDNENFVNLSFGGDDGGSFNFSSQGEISLDDDYYGIRRALWLSTDKEYKNAAENFEGKISAMKKQTLSAEDSLPDLCHSPKISVNYLDENIALPDKEKWESIARDISGVFKGNKDIFSSSVTINFIKADMYFLNSEGTETAQTLSSASVQINASTMARDGEPLKDHVLYYEKTANDLPGIEQIKKDALSMINNLVALRNAPVLDESYSGPVLFEEQAVAEIFSQKVFSSNGGLIADRKGIYSKPQVVGFMNQMKDKSLDDKIGKKVIAPTLSIKTAPLMDRFNDKNLIGSYKVDAEGVVPENELILVEKGILKTFLNGRIPSIKTKESNGHCGFRLSGTSFTSAVGPSVVIVSAEEKSSRDKLMKILIEKAKEDGTKYVYIVKKVICSNSGESESLSISSIMSFAGGLEKKGGLSKPISIYRVNVETGKEELVRGAEISGITVNSLKKVKAVSNKEFVYNTMYEGSGGGGLFSMVLSIGSRMMGGLNGKPVSFIVPDAMVIEEVEISKENRAFTSKLPVVENPIGK
jgi:predicted Zn-dependent protease